MFLKVFKFCKIFSLRTFCCLFQFRIKIFLKFENKEYVWANNYCRTGTKFVQRNILCFFHINLIFTTGTFLGIKTLFFLQSNVLQPGPVVVLIRINLKFYQFFI